MNPRRKLALRRESLAELESNLMRSVNGGTHVFSDCGCVSHGYTCDECPVFTVPVNTCYCSRNMCTFYECL